MTDETYGMTRKPFLLSPDPDAFHYTDRSILKAQMDIVAGLEGPAGLVVLTGPTGCGKTSLLLKLRRELADTLLVVLTIRQDDSTEKIFDTLFEELALEPSVALGVPVEERLLQRLSGAGLTSGAVRILVDDAQHLPKEALVALVRLASPDPVRGLRVQVLLSGLPDMVATLEQTNLSRFQHLVTIWARLGNLAQEDVAPYIQSQIEHAGGDANSIFSSAAIARIAEYTDGNPASINMLCDLCMETAQLSSLDSVGPRMVDTVAASRGLTRRKPLFRARFPQIRLSGPRQVLARIERLLRPMARSNEPRSGEDSVTSTEKRLSMSLIDRLPGGRLAWAAGAAGLMIATAAVVVGTNTTKPVPTDVTALPLPPEEEPARILSLADAPVARGVPARPDPVALESLVSTEPVVVVEEIADLSPELERLRSESEELSEQLATLRAELALVKTREERLGQELKLVAAERDRLRSESRRVNVEASARPASSAASQQAEASVSANAYQVRRGDTLWGIARSHGVAVDDLMAWNGLARGSALRTGQTIRVRADSPGLTRPTPEQSSRYTVQKGDTLYSISRRFNVKLLELSSWNDLPSSSTLRIGQQIVVSRTGGGGNS